MNNEMILTNILPSHLGRLPTVTRWVMKTLAKINYGRLLVYINKQCYACGQGDSVVATLYIKHPAKLAWRVITKGDLGFAEGFLAGDWHSDDVTQLLKLLLKNSDQLGKAYTGRKLLLATSNLYHKLHKNSLKGSRKNIAYHYDLGNDFYALWLDKSMTYSAALFSHENQSLHSAQQDKYQRILDEITVKPNDVILEIGCGWGGFAEKALQQDCTVHGITLSNEQLQYAQQRLADYGDQVTLEIKDYRHIEQQYDHIVSIEMFEAVGKEYWQTYFNMLKRSLKANGHIVLQVITIDDAYFGFYQQQIDFIQRYIFPGGMLPSEQILADLAQQNGLKITNTLNFGHDYGETLARWEQRFLATQAELEPQGYDARFQRMWRYYLGYCQAGFAEGHIDVVQLTLTHNDFIEVS